MMHRGVSIYEFKRFYPNMADWGQKWSPSTYGQNIWAILSNIAHKVIIYTELVTYFLLSEVYLR